MTHPNTLKRRKELGLCRCGKAKEVGHAMCRECLDKVVARGIKKRQERRLCGLCICGKPRDRHDRQGCKDCREKHVAAVTKAQKEKSSKGLCPCGRQKSEANHVCERCKERRRSGRSDKKLAGICTECVQFAMPGTRHCEFHTEEKRKRSRARARERRKKVIEHYGGKCACCEDATYEFLTVDHKNNDGASHRRELMNTPGSRNYAFQIVNFIVANDFPDGFQILCWNCNLAKAKHGECPHERQRREDRLKPRLYEAGITMGLIAG